MKTIAKLLFGFWYVIACAMLMIDVVSYYQLVGEDLTPIINRDMNVQFVFLIIHLPCIIMLTVMIIPNNIKKQLENE